MATQDWLSHRDHCAAVAEAAGDGEVRIPPPQLAGTASGARAFVPSWQPPRVLDGKPVF